MTSVDDNEARYAAVLRKAKELNEKLGLNPAVLVANPKQVDYAKRLELDVVLMARCNCCKGIWELCDVVEVGGYENGAFTFDGYRCKSCDRE